MSHPVKISDELILDARLTAEIAEGSHLLVRSSSGPNSDERSNPCSRAPEHSPSDGPPGAAVPLSECLASVDSATGLRVMEYVELEGPFPHYQPVPGSPGLLVRVSADGTRTVGRFVGREFQAVPCP